MGLGRAIGERRAVSGAPRHIRNAGSGFQTIINDFVSAYGFAPTAQFGGGMSIPGAWRAAILLSDMLGSVPWDGYRKIGKVEECLDPIPSMLEQPNPPDTRMTTMSSWALDLIWNGNAIGLVSSRNSMGWPTSFFAIPATMVGARRVGQNGSMAALPIGPIEYTIAGQLFDSYDILHIKGPCEPGAVRGIGVLEAHLATLNLARNQLDQANSVADQAQTGVPTGLLKVSAPDMTADEATELKAKWLASQATRTIAVLNATTEFEPLSWTPDDMEIIEARQFTNSELSLIFGVPARRLNVNTVDMTYQNIEQEDIDMWRYSVGGHLARFEQSLSLKMPRGTWAQANLNARLRPDTKTRYESHQIGINAGFLLKSEARAMENLPEVAGIDDPPEPPPAALPPIQATATVGQPVEPQAIESTPNNGSEGT